MQNNVTELTRRLLRALDDNYNVIDMPAVIEIVSLLEKVTITKELLETTRLGKHVNELRRKTSKTNDSLSKRAKELVKKWRNMILPESNGQLRSTTPQSQQQSPQPPPPPPLLLQAPQQDDDKFSLNNKKRPAKETPVILETTPTKKPKINGQNTELDFSDNSNSSFKDVINKNKITSPQLLQQQPLAPQQQQQQQIPQVHQQQQVILINSDSNSSIPETIKQPELEQQLPKKRGRKKGSKNHKNLIDEAESSFSNKLAVSRSNSKVKTTQELIAGLQNKTLGSKPKEDLTLKAAKLTERVSIIDQKLNTNANRYRKSVTKITLNNTTNSEKVIESGSVINDKNLIKKEQQYDDERDDEDEDVIVVDDVKEENDVKEEKLETDGEVLKPSQALSLSVEEALAQLPPIEIVEDEQEQEPQCTCTLKEIETNGLAQYEFVENENCGAKQHLTNKYKLHPETVSLDRVHQLHSDYLPNVNGNFGVKLNNNSDCNELLQDNGLYVNVVPNVNIECIPKNLDKKIEDKVSENFKKYSISEDDERTETNNNSDMVFREWHQILDTPSYNGEIFRILPYVIID